MVSTKLLSKINTGENKRDIHYFLLEPFLPRISKWVKKADDEKDVFDKYLALFIATNMTYNLWAKVKNTERKELIFKDSQTFMDLRELIRNHEEFLQDINLKNLTDILHRDNLVVEIVRYNKQTKKYEIEGLAQNILTRENISAERTTYYLWKTLYKIRCNLVHGEKGYEDKQIRLLTCASKILRKVLIKILGEILTACDYRYDLPQEVV